MSVIVWDGKTLAADKRACIGSLIRTTTKIFKINGCLIGYTGEACFGEQMVNWFEAGEIIAHYPKDQNNKDDWAGLLVIRPNKTIHMYERSPHPVIYHDDIFACGSGRDFAMGALLSGKDAYSAVEITCKLDHQCGNGIDALRLGV